MAADAEPLVRYRMHSANLSKDYMKTYREVNEILRRHEALALSEGDIDWLKRCRRGLRRNRGNSALQAIAEARQSLQASNSRKAIMHLSSAIRTSPPDFFSASTNFFIK